jgi:hypothetical protein
LLRNDGTRPSVSDVPKGCVRQVNLRISLLPLWISGSY